MAVNSEKVEQLVAGKAALSQQHDVEASICSWHSSSEEQEYSGPASTQSNLPVLSDHRGISQVLPVAIQEGLQHAIFISSSGASTLDLDTVAPPIQVEQQVDVVTMDSYEQDSEPMNSEDEPEANNDLGEQIPDEEVAVGAMEVTVWSTEDHDTPAMETEDMINQSSTSIHSDALSDEEESGKQAPSEGVAPPPTEGATAEDKAGTETKDASKEREDIGNSQEENNEVSKEACVKETTEGSQEGASQEQEDGAVNIEEEERVSAEKEQRGDTTTEHPSENTCESGSQAILASSGAGEADMAGSSAARTAPVPHSKVVIIPRSHDTALELFTQEEDAPTMKKGRSQKKKAVIIPRTKDAALDIFPHEEVVGVAPRPLPPHSASPLESVELSLSEQQTEEESYQSSRPLFSSNEAAEAKQGGLYSENPLPAQPSQPVAQPPSTEDSFLYDSGQEGGVEEDMVVLASPTKQTGQSSVTPPTSPSAPPTSKTQSQQSSVQVPAKKVMPTDAGLKPGKKSLDLALPTRPLAPPTSSGQGRPLAQSTSRASSANRTPPVSRSKAQSQGAVSSAPPASHLPSAKSTSLSATPPGGQSAAQQPITVSVPPISHPPPRGQSGPSAPAPLQPKTQPTSALATHTGRPAPRGQSGPSALPITDSTATTKESTVSPTPTASQARFPVQSRTVSTTPTSPPVSTALMPGWNTVVNASPTFDPTPPIFTPTPMPSVPHFLTSPVEMKNLARLATWTRTRTKPTVGKSRPGEVKVQGQASLGSQGTWSGSSGEVGGQRSVGSEGSNVGGASMVSKGAGGAGTKARDPYMEGARSEGSSVELRSKSKVTRKESGEVTAGARTKVTGLDEPVVRGGREDVMPVGAGGSLETSIASSSLISAESEDVGQGRGTAIPTETVYITRQEGDGQIRVQKVQRQLPLANLGVVSRGGHPRYDTAHGAKPESSEEASFSEGTSLSEDLSCSEDLGISDGEDADISSSEDMKVSEDEVRPVSPLSSEDEEIDVSSTEEVKDVDGIGRGWLEDQVGVATQQLRLVDPRLERRGLVKGSAVSLNAGGCRVEIERGKKVEPQKESFEVAGRGNVYEKSCKGPRGREEVGTTPGEPEEEEGRERALRDSFPEESEREEQTAEERELEGTLIVDVEGSQSPSWAPVSVTAVSSPPSAGETRKSSPPPLSPQPVLPKDQRQRVTESPPKSIKVAEKDPPKAPSSDLAQKSQPAKSSVKSQQSTKAPRKSQPIRAIPKSPPSKTLPKSSAPTKPPPPVNQPKSPSSRAPPKFPPPQPHPKSVLPPKSLQSPPSEAPPKPPPPKTQPPSEAPPKSPPPKSRPKSSPSEAPPPRTQPKSPPSKGSLKSTQPHSSAESKKSPKLTSTASAKLVSPSPAINTTQVEQKDVAPSAINIDQLMSTVRAHYQGQLQPRSPQLPSETASTQPVGKTTPIGDHPARKITPTSTQSAKMTTSTEDRGARKATPTEARRATPTEMVPPQSAVTKTSPTKTGPPSTQLSKKTTPTEAASSKAERSEKSTTTKPSKRSHPSVAPPHSTQPPQPKKSPLPPIPPATQDAKKPSSPPAQLGHRDVTKHADLVSKQLSSHQTAGGGTKTTPATDPAQLGPQDVTKHADLASKQLSSPQTAGEGIKTTPAAAQPHQVPARSNRRTKLPPRRSSPPLTTKASTEKLMTVQPQLSLPPAPPPRGNPPAPPPPRGNPPSSTYHSPPKKKALTLKRQRISEAKDSTGEISMGTPHYSLNPCQEGQQLDVHRDPQPSSVPQHTDPQPDIILLDAGTGIKAEKGPIFPPPAPPSSPPPDTIMLERVGVQGQPELVPPPELQLLLEPEPRPVEVEVVENVSLGRREEEEGRGRRRSGSPRRELACNQLAPVATLHDDLVLEPLQDLSPASQPVSNVTPLPSTTTITTSTSAAAPVLVGLKQEPANDSTIETTTTTTTTTTLATTTGPSSSSSGLSHTPPATAAEAKPTPWLSPQYQEAPLHIRSIIHSHYICSAMHHCKVSHRVPLGELWNGAGDSQ